MKNRILACLLCVLMLVGMVPVSAFAASGTCTGACAHKAAIGTTHYDTLAEALDAASKMNGAVTITLLANAELETTAELFPNAGSTVSKITIDGGQYTLTATGSGVYGFETATKIPVTFQNMKLVDTSYYTYEDGENAWEFTYLEFKGNMTFNKVAFDDGVMFEGASVKCVECSFSGHNNDSSPHGNGAMYGAWVSSGAAEFTNCTFTGTRGLKAHEAYGSDVDSLTVSGCTFGPLSEKPGVVLGNINATTEVNLTNNTVTGVQAGDQNQYLIESDTELSTFIYTATNNSVAIPGAVAQIGTVQYATFAEAVAAANAATSPATVKLLSNVELGEKLTITGDVTITGAKTITRADSYTGTLFAVNAGAKLTLDGGLVIDGANAYAFNNALYATDLANWENSVPTAESTKWFTPEEGAPVATAYMITVSGDDSAVNLNQVTIKNHYSTNGSGIVSAGKGATVTLTGAQITHNASTNGSGLVVNASAGVWSREDELITVVMNAGTIIDGNHVGGNHGIFKIYLGTYFTMNGGEIKNTTGWNSNGTAIGIYHAVFTMNGGTICSNSSVYGPNNGRNAAIYGHSNHLFTMNGGTVCHNTGRSTAGIDSPYSETGYTGLTVINGGSVVDNTILGNWTGHDVNGGETLTITGGTFTQDVNQWCAEGFAAAYDDATGTYTVVPHSADQCAPKQMSDAEGHWSVCQVCGDIVDAKAPHTAAQTSNSTHHWDACTVCGYATSEKVEHTFEKGVCTDCGAEEEGYVAPPTFDYVLFALAARYAQRYDVLVSADNATVTGDMTIKYKRAGTVEIAVAEGYQLVDVIANGQSLGAVTSVTFKKVMAPQTLVVVTEPIPTEEPVVETPAA